MIIWRTKQTTAIPTRTDGFFYSINTQTSNLKLISTILTIILILTLFFIFKQKSKLTFSLPLFYALALLFQYFTNIFSLLNSMHLHQVCLVHSSRKIEARCMIAIGILVNQQFILVISQRKFFIQKIQNLQFGYRDAIFTVNNCLPQLFLLYSFKNFEVYKWYKNCGLNVEVGRYLAVFIIECRLFLLIFRFLRGDKVECGSGKEEVVWKGSGGVQQFRYQ